ncbi:reverse transcriptase domain, reverse transcriptase zinc-binding domain protein [Tanacetum coccineum]
MGGIGIEFSSSFIGMVGNGRDIGFWLDKWVGDTRLCDRFPRLYHLDSRKEDSVAEKGRWVDNDWRWEWVWVRELRGRVMGEYNELLGTLQNVVVSNDCRDRWRWALQDDGNFTVKALSRVVEDKILCVENGALATLWNSWVPKKVNIFIWRALKGRLPVREELDRRGIDLDSLLCPCCNNVVESCNHTLILCNFAMSVWEKVFNWWRGGNVSVFFIGELFSSCGNVFIPNPLIRLWQAVIWTSGYYIWKARNDRVFKGKVTSINKNFQDL